MVHQVLTQDIATTEETLLPINTETMVGLLMAHLLLTIQILYYKTDLDYNVVM